MLQHNYGWYTTSAQDCPLHCYVRHAGKISKAFWTAAAAPVEECSSVIRCSFRLRTSKCAVEVCSILIAYQCLANNARKQNTEYHWRHVWPTRGNRPILFRGEHRWALNEVQLNRSWLYVPDIYMNNMTCAVPPCNLVQVHRRYRETYHVHRIQGRAVSGATK
jgi:hypothetical protein